MRSRATRRAPSPTLAVAVNVAAIAAVLALVGCSLPPLQAKATPVSGTGDSTTQDRTTANFTAVSVGSGINVVIANGPATAVTVTAQSNLLPLIRTVVANDQLVITIDAPGISSQKTVTLNVTSPRIDSVSLGEGATGTMEVAGDALSISLSGGATVKAIGTVTQLSLAAASGGQAQLEELSVTNATVTMSGGSQATLNVTGALGGTAADGSTIHLKVKPGTQNVKTTGGAVVTGG